MKKIKLLMPMIAATSLCGAIVPIALTSCTPQNPTMMAVAFESQGGSAVEPITVEKGKTITAPTTTWDKHHTFIGWFDQKVGGNQFDFTKPIEKNILLYAHWTVEQKGIVAQFANDKTWYEGDIITRKDIEVYAVDYDDKVDTTSPITNWTSLDMQYMDVEGEMVLGHKITCITAVKQKITIMQGNFTYNLYFTPAVRSELTFGTKVFSVYKSADWYTGSEIKLYLNGEDVTNSDKVTYKFTSKEIFEIKEVNSKKLVVAKEKNDNWEYDTILATYKDTTSGIEKRANITVYNTPGLFTPTYASDHYKIKFNSGVEIGNDTISIPDYVLTESDGEVHAYQVTEIEENAMSGVEKGIKKLIMPKTITTIGANALSYSGLNTVLYRGTTSEYTSTITTKGVNWSGSITNIKCLDTLANPIMDQPVENFKNAKFANTTIAGYEKPKLVSNLLTEKLVKDQSYKFSFPLNLLTQSQLKEIPYSQYRHIVPLNSEGAIAKDIITINNIYFNHDLTRHGESLPDWAKKSDGTWMFSETIYDTFLIDSMLTIDLKVTGEVPEGGLYLALVHKSA